MGKILYKFLGSSGLIIRFQSECHLPYLFWLFSERVIVKTVNFVLFVTGHSMTLWPNTYINYLLWNSSFFLPINFYIIGQLNLIIWFGNAITIGNLIICICRKACCKLKYGITHINNIFSVISNQNSLYKNKHDNAKESGNCMSYCTEMKL